MHGVSDSPLSKNRSALPGAGSCPSRLSNRARLVLRMLPSELGLPLPRQQQPHSSWRGSVRQLGLIIPLLALMWFVRLYLHYCSQWLYLQAIAVPVNKWVCFLWYCPERTYTHTHTRMGKGGGAWIHMHTHIEQNYIDTFRAHTAADINPYMEGRYTYKLLLSWLQMHTHALVSNTSYMQAQTHTC